MAGIRPPAVAGSFYPADPKQLQTMVDGLLATARIDDGAVPTTPGMEEVEQRRERLPEQRPKAVIAPHAGYIYSGPVAASVYARLKPLRGRITRVVLLGPSHRVGFEGLAFSSADYYDTPLGRVPLDKSAERLLTGLPQVRVYDAAHAREHSLEVHLPFLQVTLATPGMEAAPGHPGPRAALLRPWRAEVRPRRATAGMPEVEQRREQLPEQRPSQFTLVPLVVGDATPQQVGEVLERLWGGPETLIVISSDLSHYHDYATARRLDRATSDAIEALRYEDIGYEDACGRTPVGGLLYVARRHGLRARLLDLRNSGDTAGPRDRVVGYGAYAVG